MLKRVLLALFIVLRLGTAVAADDLLDPEKAFQFSARAEGDKTVLVHFKIADGYYMYRERFKFAARSADVRLGEAVLPQGKVKFDETFQKNVETYRGGLDIRIPVQQAAGPFEVVVTSQGCADIGVCYPPMESTARITLAASAAPASVTATGKPPASFADRVAAGSATPPPGAEPGPAWKLDGNDEARIGAALASGSLWLVVGAFLLLGLGLALTPCVYPMLPILSAIIVGHGTRVTRGRGLALAAAYSMGMAIVFTAIGVAAGLLGEGLAAMLQKPAVLAAFALVLVALALSMFGFYNLQMPAAIQGRLNARTGRLQTGSLGGVFAMGALSALVVGPCVTPPLSAALLYIGRTGDAVLGGVALFVLAWGMCVPLLVIGTSAGSVLPKAGPWMESVKHVFGALLLAAALWILSPVLPDWVQMSAWGVFLIICASYLRVFDRLPEEASGWRRLWKGVGATGAVAGALLLVGVASGGRDLWQPLAHWAQRLDAGSVGLSSAAAAAPRFERVKTVAELDERIKAAGKPVMLDFYADWCVSCKEMERFTFSDPRVMARLNDFLVLQADVTANDADDKALLKRFKLYGPPGIIFFDAAGRESERRVIGYQPPERFLQSLETAAGS